MPGATSRATFAVTRKRSDSPAGAIATNQQNDRTWRPNLLVAIDLFAFLVALLRFHRERRDRARLQPLQRDRLAGLLAIAVGVVLDAQQRGVDLGDQLALAVAGAHLARAVCLRRCPVRP